MGGNRNEGEQGAKGEESGGARRLRSEKREGKEEEETIVYSKLLRWCYFLSPLHHSGFTAVAAFLLTREVWNSRAGLLAACFIAIVPGYISRSVAGSYDNEGIAIFALLFTYFLWLKSVKTGSVFWSTCASLSYFYMVSRGW